MDYFRFFFLHTDRTFYRPVPYPMHKFFFSSKNTLNFYLLKVNNFYGDSVKNKSMLGQKKTTGGERVTPNAPPPSSLFKVKDLFEFPSLFAVEL